jgi:hypothetical protein
LRSPPSASPVFSFGAGGPTTPRSSGAAVVDVGAFAAGVRRLVERVELSLEQQAALRVDFELEPGEFAIFVDQPEWFFVESRRYPPSDSPVQLVASHALARRGDVATGDSSEPVRRFRATLRVSSLRAEGRKYLHRVSGRDGLLYASRRPPGEELESGCDVDRTISAAGHGDAHERVRIAPMTGVARVKVVFPRTFARRPAYRAAGSDRLVTAKFHDGTEKSAALAPGQTPSCRSLHPSPSLMEVWVLKHGAERGRLEWRAEGTLTLAARQVRLPRTAAARTPR